MKQNGIRSWFAGLSRALKITVCAVVVAVAVGIAFGAFSLIQWAGRDANARPIVPNDEIITQTNEQKDETGTPEPGIETVPEAQTDADQSDHNDTPEDDAHAEYTPQEDDNELLAIQEHIFYPAWVMDDVIEVSSGDFHTMIIKEDGSLWGWGGNFYGTLGDGTNETRRSPVWIMDDVVAVSAGYEHTMAIREDGSLWGWGSNFHGELGDGTTESRHSPVWIMDDVVAVSTSSAPDPGPSLGHTMAISSDGSLWGWGANENGQLGDGTTQDRHSPVRVMQDVTAVAADSWSTTVLKTDGSLWQFRLDWFNEDEGGTNAETQTHHLISNDVSAISDCGTMFIKHDGSLFRIGHYWDYVDELLALPLTYIELGIDNVIAASSGAMGTTVALRGDGSLWGWGSNINGQLGIGVPGDYDLEWNREIPVWIIDDVISVSVGARHVMTIRNDGSLWGWGWNIAGQIGTNET